MTITCPHCAAGNSPDARVCVQCGGSLSPSAAPRDVEKPFRGERRQLTALFCDIVGSTEFAKTLDPEEYQDTIAEFVSRCTAAVTPLEGHIAELRGDGALVHFGYPRAHGDEPERAIRAALAIVEAIGHIVTARGAPLRVRIGIATGVVAISEGIFDKPSIVGEAVILAARLQEIAEPDTIVVSDLTRSLAGEFFEMADLGALPLKGFDAPMHAWRVLGAKAEPNRFKAKHLSGLSAFVGRERERGIIMNAWRDAVGGHGRVVALAGEAGIGKSRLIRNVRDGLRQESLAVEYFCSPYHATTALFPVTDRIARMNFQPDDTAAQRLEALRALLKAAGPGYEAHLSSFAQLMSVPDKSATSGTPQQRKHRMFESILWWIAAHARRHPLLLILEDAHWCDPTSAELLEALVERIGTLPALMIVSVRTPFDAAWMHHRDVVKLPLDKLDDRDANALVAGVTGVQALPPPVVRQILQHTDGIPLFIEEFTKMMLGGAGLAALDRAPGEARPDLPVTLRESLLARLDQLAPDKQVAQCAAVIGREFRRDVLAAISPLPAYELDRSLERLVDAGLVFPQGTGTATRYLFKHALVRDVAYDSLLRRDRRRLHAAVASALERQHPAQVRHEPELLAYHYSEAGLIPQSLRYWGIAALRALERSANAEVIAHTGRAFELLVNLPDTRERRLHELGLRFLSGGAQWAAKGFASPDVEQTFLRAQELAAEVGDPAQTVIALRGLFGCYYARGELDRAQQQGEAVTRVATRSGSHADLTVGHMEVGSILFWRGDLVAARRELETAISLYDPAEHRARLLSTQVDPGANARYHLSWTLWTLGFPDQALASADRAVEAGRDIAQPLTLAMALFWRGVVKLCRGDDASAATDIAELRALATEFHIRFVGATTTVLEGALLIEQGDAHAGIARIEEAFAEFEHQRAGLGRPWTLSLVAAACLRGGMAAHGLAAVEEGLAAVKQHGEAHWHAELLRLKAELMFALPGADPCAVASTLRESLDVARRQGARALELRAASSLRRLMAADAEARGALDGVLAHFTEGLSTRDVVDGLRLLAVPGMAVAATA